MLLLPTIPTILDETVAKKKPNTTINNAPSKLTGISGINHIPAAITNEPIKTTDIGKSCCVLSPPDTFFPKPLIADLNVLNIVGKVLIKLMIPPAATAPAPIYLIYLLQIVPGSNWLNGSKFPASSATDDKLSPPKNAIAGISTK